MNTYEAVQLADALLEQPRISAKELRHLLDSGALAELVHAARCSDAYEDDRPPPSFGHAPKKGTVARMLWDTATRAAKGNLQQIARNRRLFELLRCPDSRSIFNYDVPFSDRDSSITEITRRHPTIGP